MADEENLSYKAIRVTDGGGIAVPAEPRRDLRALRRAYEEGTHRDIVALKKRARRVWKKLKKFGIHESVVLDASFGWWGASENAILSAVTLAENETGKARRRDIASDGKSLRELIQCAKTGVKLAKDGVFEDDPAANKRIEAYVKGSLETPDSLVHKVNARVEVAANAVREEHRDAVVAYLRESRVQLIAYACGLRRKSQVLEAMMRELGRDAVGGFVRAVHEVRNGPVGGHGIEGRGAAVARKGRIIRSAEDRRLGACSALTSFQNLVGTMFAGHEVAKGWHTRPRGANGPRICGFFFGTSYDWSIMGLGCSRFMIHESGSMFGFARVGWCINSVINVNIKDGTLQIRKRHGKP